VIRVVSQSVYPGSADAESIERQAEKFTDPLERLQYLRRATTANTSRAIRQRRIAAAAVLALVLLASRSDAHFHRAPGVRLSAPAAPSTVHAGVSEVWVVEENRDFETYSNGLRIENRLAVSNQPRSYLLVPRDGAGATGPPRAQPVGIVFHTTESRQAPFEPKQNHQLQRIGRELLLFVRGKRAYHYVIDRFGVVHRIVFESDSANHAGNSVWADASHVYLDLNNSFLGVAFEASITSGEMPINQAQVHAAAVLTEMLRSKYNIAAENCVTHAQVSVNPDNMRIGWHADWGKNFPFDKVGLPDNYLQPLPSIYLFGFSYDPVYWNATGPEIWKSLAQSEELLRQGAAVQGKSVAEFRATLAKRYITLKQHNLDDEND